VGVEVFLLRIPDDVRRSVFGAWRTWSEIQRSRSLLNLRTLPAIMPRGTRPQMLDQVKPPHGSSIAGCR